MKGHSGILTVSVFVAAAVAAGRAGAADAACLRGDNIGYVKMVSADKALATDKQDGQFDIVFTGPCGARFLNVFFVLKPENLPVCVVPGTAFPTNSRGICVVKSVVRAK